MTRHTLGKPREGCSYINHVPSGNDNIQVDLRKYLAMASCLISAVIDLSLRSQLTYQSTVEYVCILSVS